MKSAVLLRRAISPLLIGLAIVSLWFVPSSRAVNPPPDGGYPGFNTAEGQKALLNLNTATGIWNTAVGAFSLRSNVNNSNNTAVGTATLFFNTADRNTAVGAVALLLNTTGSDNTAIGTAALLNNSDGLGNTATGSFALNANTHGSSNTANGLAAMQANTTGGFNTATGSFALASNTTGSDNTAVGAGALENNTGDTNTAVGSAALLFNGAGASNTAIGFQALMNNNGGSNNTASGINALTNNTTGSANTAAGAGALHNNNSSNNTATGFGALAINSTGGSNTAMGFQVLGNNTGGDSNTVIGDTALFNNTTGSSNTALGDHAGFNATTGDNNVYIGASMQGAAGESGHTYIRNINSTSVSGGGTDTVTVNLSTGLLGHATSSRRYKNDIKPIGSASEVLYRLKPVSYRYKKEIDSSQSPAFGLIAEEVAEVNSSLVARNSDGQPESVHYEMVNAMLLNEFLKEHDAFLEEQKKVRALEAALAAVNQRLKEQAAKIERVSAGLELTKATTALVRGNP